MVYYGDTVGFVLAWVAGVSALLVGLPTGDEPAPRVDRVAAVAPAGR